MHTIKRRSYENDTETEVFGNHLKFQGGFFGYVSTTIIQGVSKVIMLFGFSSSLVRTNQPLGTA